MINFFFLLFFFFVFFSLFEVLDASAFSVLVPIYPSHFARSQTLWRERNAKSKARRAEKKEEDRIKQTANSDEGSRRAVDLESKKGSRFKGGGFSEFSRLLG